MSKPKLVLWDIGNVLIHADHTITHQLLEIRNVQRDRAERFYQQLAYGCFARGRLTGLEFYYQQLVNLIRSNLSLWDMIEAHDRHMTHVIPAAVELVRRCNVPIAFATSTNEWQDIRERQLLKVDELDPVWTYRSHKHGRLKTDEGCMASIAGELGRRIKVRASEILFIDDSTRNIDAATRAGFQTYLYTCNTGAEACEKFLSEQGLLR